MDATLEASLNSLIDLLARLPGVGAPHWRTELEFARAELASGSRSAALTRIRACFGGMGSLTDLYISPDNGNVPPGGLPADLNRRLDEQRSHLWDLVDRAT
jgi:hypothetical protein